MSFFFRRWGVPALLIALTFLSTLYVGHTMEPHANSLWDGWRFALPLMAILLAHEFGHYIAGKIHGVAISPPYFIPVPFFLLGTMGAVINMRERIRTRNALLDVGAAGPLAGLAIALPVLIYGIATSHVGPATAGTYLIEGRSLLYLAILRLIHGPIPEGHDIWLNSTAFAGWAGLLITMINLIPVAQLDGGHVAYALFGPRQNLYSERLRKALPLFGLVISLIYAAPAIVAGRSMPEIASEALAGIHWILWAGILWVLTRVSGKDHPPTLDQELSPKRRRIALVTLSCFVLLFMPSWLRTHTTP